MRVGGEEENVPKQSTQPEGNSEHTPLPIRLEDNLFALGFRLVVPIHVNLRELRCLVLVYGIALSIEAHTRGGRPDKAPHTGIPTRFQGRPGSFNIHLLHHLPRETGNGGDGVDDDLGFGESDN